MTKASELLADAGPWSIDGFDQIIAGEPDYGSMIIAADGESIVAQCVAEHNLDLIRAAPELFDALLPFASFDPEEIDGAPDDMSIEQALYQGSQPTVGDLRRAAAVIGAVIRKPMHDLPVAHPPLNRKQGE